MTGSQTVAPVQVPTEPPAVGSRTSRQQQHDPTVRASVWVKIAIIVICLLWIIPTIGLIITSFRTPDAARTSGWRTVFTTPANFSKLTLQNYSDVFQKADMGTAFVNSLAIWLAHIGFGMPLAVYITRNYMATLPKEVIESAKIDGASHFQTFWRLILPMSTPVLASFAIFQFLWVWNDLLNALVFIGPGENQPLTIALVSLLGQQGQGWQLITAGGLVTMIIPIIVFLSLQRYFVRGLTAGSVKG